MRNLDLLLSILTRANPKPCCWARFKTSKGTFFLNSSSSGKYRYTNTDPQIISLILPHVYCSQVYERVNVIWSHGFNFWFLQSQSKERLMSWKWEMKQCLWCWPSKPNNREWRLKPNERSLLTWGSLKIKCDITGKSNTNQERRDKCFIIYKYTVCPKGIRLLLEVTF